MRLCTSIVLAAACWFFASAAPAAQPVDDAAVVRAVLAQPADRIDFARAKLTFDKLVDPTIDIEAALKQIGQMEQAVRAMAGADAPPLERLRAVRMYIYVAGPWNGFKPYAYDMSDPYGTKLSNKLLPTYLATRRGNCVSMPFLFIILADRLGLHVTAATAPFHVMAEYIDDASGKSYKLETTSGALPARDAWYREKFPMTDKAVASGLYLRPLAREEVVALMAQTVLERDMAAKRYRAAVALADVILSVYPKSDEALLLRGSAYGRMAEAIRAAHPVDFAARDDFRSAMAKNHADFSAAEALGWREAADASQNGPDVPA